MNAINEFKQEVSKNIENLGRDKKLKKVAIQFIVDSLKHKYVYNYNWLGRPIIQYPQDIVAIQELIWQIKPDLIIETGIAHGGSLILSASILELIGGRGRVVGIDIDIRRHNRKEIERHRMFKRITLVEGSSIDNIVIKKVAKIAQNKKRIMVFLDSNHTHSHVLKELELYNSFVTKGSYLVVFDTVVEDMPRGTVKNRSWNKGNNPKTAVWEFLGNNKNFIVDKKIEDKLLITSAPNGFLKRVK